MDDNLQTLLGDLPVITPEDTVDAVPVVEGWKKDLSEAEVQALIDQSTKLLKKHTHLMGSALSSVCARQLYNLATFTLNRDLEELGVRQDEGVYACIIDSMGELAMKAFSRDKVVDYLKRYALPFAMSEMQRELRERDEQDQKAEAQAATIRKDVPIPVAIARDLGGPTTMDRDRTVVIAGPRKLVRLLLDKMTNEALLKPELSAYNPRIVVARLAEALSVSGKGGKDKTYARVGARQWIGAADSPTAFEKFINRWRRACYRERIDLLVVDDITVVQKEHVKNTAPEQLVANAQRVLRKWADKATCGVLAGFPLDEIPDKFEGEAWRQLEVYTELRVVTTRPGENGQAVLCLYNPWKGVEQAHALYSVDSKLVE